MRISTNMSFDSFLFQQQRLSGALFTDQYRLSTGQSVSVPSDNPLQATRVLKLTAAEESQLQLLKNIQFARDYLNATDAALTEVSDLMIRVQTLASDAVNSTVIPAEREAAAIEVDSIIQQLTSIVNRQYQGLYLFGGRDVQSQPLLDELGGLHYVGDTGDLLGRVAEDRDEEFNLTADDAFMLLSDQVRGTVDLNPALTRETRLDELLGANGLGIRLGSLRFEEDGAAESYSVDLTGATSIGQVVDQINAAAAAAGSTLTAEINAAGNGLLITPGDAVTISTLDSGVVASDLGITVDVPTADPIVGLDLDRRLTPTTPIADLLGGAGIDFAGNSFVIRNDDLSITVDLSTAQTVQDILNTINNTGVGVRASLNTERTGIDIRNEVSGTRMSIEENGGTAAGLLGIRTFNGETLLADLNDGLGVRLTAGEDDLEIIAKDGSSITVNLDDALTVQQTIDAVNTAATTAGIAITASLTTTGNGLRIVDGTGGAGQLQINSINASGAATDLGLNVDIAADATEVAGEDVARVGVQGLFDALIALREALTTDVAESNEDEQAITIAAQRINEMLDHVAAVQGQLGAEVRSIDSRITLTEQAVDATSTLLGEVRDLDYTEAISRFQQTQTTLQASLLANSQTLNLSLLNYLS
ncbi:MAG: hypothetical protein HJJLKODD_00485 [Phycisphaerae bacterium]|nr:hypothetical protein [Phycisphaerae bacterium]